MDFATGLVGHYRGGPAKVAVIASAFHGTISGSAPANVLTVGPVTIPMMKRLGFPPHMAGAIEAAASTGGVIMPPVMGSVAFIMASFIGVSYSVVALYAVIPALLYFFGVFCTVHWTAVRYGIRGLTPSEMPDWKRSFRERGHLLAPVGVLIALMALDFSPQYGAAYAILSVIVVSWLRRGTRMGPRAILAALEAGAKGAVLVAIATAAAGLIVGAFELSSVGLKLAQGASAMAGTLLTGLILTMIVSLLLGAGVPPSVAYIVQIAVTIPMLQTFLAADGAATGATAIVLSHFFVMYFSSLAVLTPPDALASVAAAGLAGTPFMKTGLAATRVAFVAFVVPFMFVYRPALLTLGSPAEIVEAVVFSVLGVFIASIGLEGTFRAPLPWWERAIALAAGAALIFPGWKSDALGVVLMAVFLAMQYWPGRTATAR
jgi:TRAP transporter 4TM/12TM fusion protein